MRVTLVTETYFPQVNGVSRTLGELVRFLDEGGDQVQLIHPDYGVADARSRTIRVPSITLPFYKELRLPRPPFGAVFRAIKAFEPDVVHIATEATLGLSVLCWSKGQGMPVVSSFHTNFDQYSDHYRVSRARAVIWRYLRWFHNGTRMTFVPSETTISDLEQRGFERLVLWKRGVDSAMFRPQRPGRAEVRAALGWAPDDLVITYISRIAAEKNVDYLAEALAIVAARRPGVRILWVGDGPERASIERRIGSFAHFAGYRQGEELADHYAASDIFAFSSVTETFGNVVLEAMASGLPVVALRAGGVGETVQSGKTGILIAPTEPPEHFASALISLIDQEDQRTRMAAAARDYALTQSWDKIMFGLREHYQTVVDGRDQAPRAMVAGHQNHRVSV